MKTIQINLTPDAQNYKNQWVAFSGDFQRVVGHGKTAKEASDMARAAHEPHAILYFIEEHPDEIHI